MEPTRLDDLEITLDKAGAALLKRFNEVKSASRLAVYLYLIQRL